MKSISHQYHASNPRPELMPLMYNVSMKATKNTYKDISAIVWKEGNLFVAKSLEVEIASQGSTKQEALNNLTEALELYFEDEPTFSNFPILKDISLEKVDVKYA